MWLYECAHACHFLSMFLTGKTGYRPNSTDIEQVPFTNNFGAQAALVSAGSSLGLIEEGLRTSKGSWSSASCCPLEHGPSPGHHFPSLWILTLQMP